jgi:hypothetical protein
VQPLPCAHKSDVQVTVFEQLSWPVHSTSHAHELLHETPRHELEPEHVTSHGPVPHCTFLHELVPEHSTAHDAPPMQLTPLRHWLSCLHSIVQ